MLKHYLPLAIIPLGLILWGLFGATQLTAYSFAAFINYQSLYKERGAPGSAGDALSPQVVIVVMEGLRLDQSRQMANLNRLRGVGISGRRFKLSPATRSTSARRGLVPSAGGRPGPTCGPSR